MRGKIGISGGDIRSKRGKTHISFRSVAPEFGVFLRSCVLARSILFASPRSKRGHGRGIAPYGGVVAGFVLGENIFKEMQKGG